MPPTSLPSDPRTILDLARPLYDFSSSDLKPWHFKASYQLYDDNEAPTEQGTFEYWWVSPDSWRTSWTRPSGNYTYWQLPGHNSARLGAADALSYPESRLKSTLLSPLPSDRTLGAATTQLEKRAYGKDTNALQCVMVGVKMKEMPGEPIGLFPTYCFMAKLPILALYVSYASPIVEFNQVVKVQNRYFPKQVKILSPAKKNLLTATVDAITPIQPTDPALTPPENADRSKPIQIIQLHEKKSSPASPSTTAAPTATTPLPRTITIAGGIAQGMILKKVAPIYPDDAKHARVSGTVTIQAVIGTDGWVHDMQVLTAPSASMAASSLGAVSQWRYRPYLLNGSPVEVQTTINVIYSLGP